MRNRFLAFCLMLVLVLSLAPAQIFADSSSQSYTVIATGIEATHIDIMSNGHCAYKVIDGYEIPRKGVIAPSGKAVVTLDFGGDPIYIGVNGTTHAVGYGTTIVDLPTSSHKSADGTKSWSDYPVYDIDGKPLGYILDIIKDYAGSGIGDDGNISCGYYGNDGYLTVVVVTGGGDQYFTYIIDLQKLEVVYSMQTYSSWLPEGAEIHGVNEGLITYKKTYTEYGEDGWTTTITSAGWMDLNGKQVIAIDSDKYVSWEDFSNGRAAVLQDSPRAYGYFDKSGKLVIPCNYFNASMFIDGYAAVSISNNDLRFGYIDTAGKTIIPFQYEDACGYGEGLFTVGIRVAGDEYWLTKYGMVDKNNTVVVPCEYDVITPVKNGAAYAIKDGKVFVLKFSESAPVDPNDVSNIFKDVPANAWYKKYLQNAYDSKIIAGTSATTYAPAANLNHGQIMVMAANLHSRQKDDKYDFQGNKKVGEAWYQVFEDYCKAEGIIDGRFDGKETQNVTREEMAYYFANTLDDKYYKNKKSVSFSDMPENGYDEYIMKLAKADIVGGKGEGKYDPSALVTRAEAAVFVSNILDAFQ